ncbi:MAG: hypothetical protein EXR94_00040 [Gemmatimonadetes bacterium]|nr:hypothetical protein [Gemmatimonadota bacterium]
MSTYHLAGDYAPPGQLTLGLQIEIDPAGPLSSLHPGDRFLLAAGDIEGKLVSWGSGSITVAVRGSDDRWTRTTWSPNTQVRRMRG